MRNPLARNSLWLAAVLMAVFIFPWSRSAFPAPAASTPAAAADENTRLTIQVLTDETKKPVASAHVVVRFVSGKKLFIKKIQTSWEAQTNKKGEVALEDIPLGEVKIQVIAKGYQTFGDDFKLSKSDETLTILMKPPAKQISGY
jgi:Carboxypeptidase regulatory-like domain